MKGDLVFKKPLHQIENQESFLDYIKKERNSHQVRTSRINKLNDQETSRDVYGVAGQS